MTLEGMLRGLAGGALIGLAAALALIAHGRIAGISGILGRGLGDLSRALRPAVTPPSSSPLARATTAPGASDASGARFRWPFLAGLVVTGALASALSPSAIGGAVRDLPVLAVAGLLVGFGATLANGCTSGHGVCGIARLSRRSFVAVATFMTTAALTVALAGAHS